jgi:hypothetical protein
MKGRARLAAALAAIAACSLAGCGNKQPQISALEWRLETRPANGGPDYESLSVFASIRDEDGLDNIAEIWVVKDDADLAWKITDSDWVKTADGNDTWFGASALASPDLAAMPRGSYRLIAIDGAGQRVEEEFKVAGNFPGTKAPEPEVSGGKLSVSSAWPETLAMAFDGVGALLVSVKAPGSPTSLEGVFGTEAASRAALIGAYGYDPGTHMGAFSARIKTR